MCSRCACVSVRAPPANPPWRTNQVSAKCIGPKPSHMYEIPVTLFQKLVFAPAARSLFATASKVEEIVTGREVRVASGLSCVLCVSWVTPPVVYMFPCTGLPEHTPPFLPPSPCP